jgi:hypothetical protein
MATENTLSQQLLDLLATRDLHPEMLDRSGRPTDAPDAKTFTFDYEGASGKNYGTMVIVLDSDNEMKIMYGDNLGRTMEGTDKNEFFDFIQHLSRKATMNRWTHTIADISQLKHTMQGLAAIQEGLFEGYYGNRNISYAGAPTQARLKIKHSQPLGENDARFRHVESLFVETADGECFRLGFRNLSGGRAMLEHVRQGGKPYDIRGCHLTEMVSEIATLSRFNRASAGRVLEGVTQEVVSQAQVYYKQLRENLKRMSTARGYSKYFESWHPADITEQEELVENIKTLFVEQTIDTRIEQALPLLAKIQQGRDMKEAEIFESWINNLAEGTWNLPETPEQLDKLKTLMASELIVGPDAINATEQLYDLVGDDILFDRLSELAAQDPRANAFNDTEVMNRLAELGIQMPEPTEPGNPAEPQTAPEQPPAVAEGAPELLKKEMPLHRHAEKLLAQNGVSKDDPDYHHHLGNTIKHLRQFGNIDLINKQGVAESAELNTMLKYAGVPVAESRMIDESGETLMHVLDRFRHEVAQFEQGADLDDNLFDALYDYYVNKGEMPYGTAKARSGDPYEWVSDRLDQELGTGNHTMRAVPEADAVSTFEVMSGFDAPVAEGACNMTAEGSYCPEHGLAECGGGMYESREGDAVLARIKSLALLK